MSLFRPNGRALAGLIALVAALLCGATTVALEGLPDYRYSGAVLLGFLALVYAGFSLLRPRAAFLVFLGLAPLLNAYMFFTGHAPDPRPGAFKHVLWTAVVAGWFLRGAASGDLLARGGRSRHAADTLLLLYVGYAIAQASRALPFGSLRGLFMTMQGVRQEVEFLLAFFVARDLLRERRDLLRAGRALGAGTAMAAAVGILQLLHLLPPPFEASRIGGVERVDSIVMEANNFAWTLALGLPLFLVWTTRPALDLRRRLGALLAVGAYGVLIAASGSRTGFVLFACGTVAVFLARRRPALLLAFLPGVAAFLFAFPALSERFQSMADVGEVDEARVTMWRRLVQVAELNPLFGGGYGWVGGAVRGVSAEGTQWADSTVVHIGVGFGLVGLALFGSAVVAGLVAAWRALRGVRDGEVRALGAGAAGVLFGCLAISPVHIPWIPFPAALYAWTLLGILVGFERFEAPKPTDGGSPAPTPRGQDPSLRSSG